MKMCGRFSLAADEFSVKVYLSSKYQIKEQHTFLELPRYNIAPGQMVLSLISDGSHYRHGYLKWGFIPKFDQNKSNLKRIINFRSESIWDKPYLVKPVRQQRCVVLADGFYEWQKQQNGKIPYRIQTSAGGLFTMAGLWETYLTDKGQKEYTVALLTTSANSKMKEIHERMPVILDDVDAKVWLDPKEQDHAQLEKLLKPYPASKTRSYIVSDAVNSYQNDSSECIAQINRS